MRRVDRTLRILWKSSGFKVAMLDASNCNFQSNYRLSVAGGWIFGKYKRIASEWQSNTYKFTWRICGACQRNTAMYAHIVYSATIMQITFKWKFLQPEYTHGVCASHICSPARREKQHATRIIYDEKQMLSRSSTRWCCWFFSRFSHQFPHESEARA